MSAHHWILDIVWVTLAILNNMSKSLKHIFFLLLYCLKDYFNVRKFGVFSAFKQLNGAPECYKNYKNLKHANSDHFRSLGACYASGRK